MYVTNWIIVRLHQWEQDSKGQTDRQTRSSCSLTAFIMCHLLSDLTASSPSCDPHSSHFFHRELDFRYLQERGHWGGMSVNWALRLSLCQSGLNRKSGPRASAVFVKRPAEMSVRLQPAEGCSQENHISETEEKKRQMKLQPDLLTSIYLQILQILPQTLSPLCRTSSALCRFLCWSNILFLGLWCIRACTDGDIWICLDVWRRIFFQHHENIVGWVCALLQGRHYRTDSELLSLAVTQRWPWTQHIHISLICIRCLQTTASLLQVPYQTNPGFSNPGSRVFQVIVWCVKNKPSPDVGFLIHQPQKHNSHQVQLEVSPQHQTELKVSQLKLPQLFPLTLSSAAGGSHTHTHSWTILHTGTCRGPWSSGCLLCLEGGQEEEETIWWTRLILNITPTVRERWWRPGHDWRQPLHPPPRSLTQVFPLSPGEQR